MQFLPFFETLVGDKKFQPGKEQIKIKSLTSKERLFCTYYSLSRNGKEAAIKSGYAFPEKSALRLLKKQEILQEIKRLDEMHNSRENDIISGYYRLAFGCFADAVSLLFSEEISPETIQQLDLFNISEIKRKKNGETEIKFFDRLKALEKLESSALGAEKSSAFSLYHAIEKGASALRKDCDE